MKHSLEDSDNQSSLACEKCRKSKKKCDKKKPVCSSCQVKKISCVYNLDQRKRQEFSDSTVGFLRLEEEVKRLGNTLKNLTPTNFQVTESNSAATEQVAAPGTRHEDPNNINTSTSNWNITPSWLDLNPFDFGLDLSASNVDAIQQVVDINNNDNQKSSSNSANVKSSSSSSHSSSSSSSSSSSYQHNSLIPTHQTSSLEEKVLLSLPSRKSCFALLDYLQAQITLSPPFSSNPADFINIEACRNTVETLLYYKELSTLLPPPPLSPAKGNPVQPSASEQFQALAALACAYHQEISTHIKSSSRLASPSNFKVGTPAPCNTSPNQELDKLNFLLDTCKLCMIASGHGNSSILDLAKLQGHRLLALTLSWCGFVTEAANVTWLGFRNATSVGIHRKDILATFPIAIQPALLDVFWQMFIHASIFQLWTGRDLPIDVTAIDIPFPIFNQGSRVPFRIQAQLTASLIADKYYRHFADGLKLPGENRLSISSPLSSLSVEDWSNFQIINDSLDLIQFEMFNHEEKGDSPSTCAAFTLQGNHPQGMLFVIQYIRLLGNYPFSTQISQAKKTVEDVIKTNILSIWNLSKEITGKEKDNYNDNKNNNNHKKKNNDSLMIVAGILLRTMIFAANSQSKCSSSKEAQIWSEHLSLGYDALERVCKDVEKESAVLKAAARQLLKL